VMTRVDRYCDSMHLDCHWIGSMATMIPAALRIFAVHYVLAPVRAGQMTFVVHFGLVRVHAVP
jgi:hypothetical protein